MKYSDQIADWLVEFGYTHCFYVGGGNIMHLVESLSRKLDCRAVIHEVAAGIAAEYFNETSDSGKALALVTAGPGLTNIVTAMASAYVESRELLVIGGQVKTSDLALGKLRQNGIQELDGARLVQSISNLSVCITEVINKIQFSSAISTLKSGRRGPVFLEIPLDIQAAEVNFENSYLPANASVLPVASNEVLNDIAQQIRNASRPILMIGGGVSRRTANKLRTLLQDVNIPIVTTWNGADRVSSGNQNYMGRPNTWGQRSSNIILQQSDLLIAFGTRLGMQQTGFNWQQFVPCGKIIQIDVDGAELSKGHPKIDIGLAVDANDLLERLLTKSLGNHSEWLRFCQDVRKLLPLVEMGVNKTNKDFVPPHEFVQKLSSLATESDVIVPCSSGGAFTLMMQVFENKSGQKIVTNKGMASMGYGLSGAIGASIANPENRVVLVEGDGGFAQNIQEIGTAAINNCNLKIFILDDNGQASIRSVQRNYFGGRYVGCDTETGLGLPNWLKLFSAWDVKVVNVDRACFENGGYISAFNNPGLTAFVVKIDPEQTYLPKISSKMVDGGGMVSNPLHVMTPALSEDLSSKVFKYIKEE